MTEDSRVYISIPFEEYRLMVRLLAESAEDLETYISAVHPARSQYPSEMRRYERDMALVKEIRLAIEEYGKRGS